MCFVMAVYSLLNTEDNLMYISGDLSENMNVVLWQSVSFLKSSLFSRVAKVARVARAF